MRLETCKRSRQGSDRLNCRPRSRRARQQENAIDPYADKPAGVYRFTSIGRPLDPRYPTNRAVLVLLPALAMAGASIVLLAGEGWMAALAAGLMFMLVAFGTWALTRELAPDDNPAAFIAIALGIAQVFAGTDSVLLVFVALFLVRIVNRTTGLAPRPLDSLAVLGFAAWAMDSLGQPLLGLVAALAFALDALLPAGRRWQLVPALLACALAVRGIATDGITLAPRLLTSGSSLIVAVVLLAYSLATWRSRRVVSVADIGGERLQASRVQAGMVIGALVVVQAYLVSGPVMLESSPTWASLVAVPLGAMLRMLYRR